MVFFSTIQCKLLENYTAQHKVCVKVVYWIIYSLSPICTPQHKLGVKVGYWNCLYSISSICNGLNTFKTTSIMISNVY